MKRDFGRPAESQAGGGIALELGVSAGGRRVLTFQDAEAVAQAVAERIASRARDAVAARGIFRLGLAGGSTPVGTFQRLAASDGPGRDVPWSGIEIFWGDERFVESDHPDRNSKAGFAALIDHVPLQVSSVHIVPGPDQVESPQHAAEAYEDLLRAAARSDPSGAPLDLVLLGLGEDGHTASLFPGDPLFAGQLEGKATPHVGASAWTRAVLGPTTRPPRERITLTLDAFEASREVLFIVTGASKREMLLRILGPRVAVGSTVLPSALPPTLPATLPAPLPAPLPAELVRARCGVTWFVDAAALGLTVGG